MGEPRGNKTPKTFPVEPDREILIWEKWITIRKEETHKLGKQLQRPPADLVMNLVVNVREDKERKAALSDAQIEEKVGVRDNLWEQPLRLAQNCYCEPVYEVHRTRAETGRPPIVEHIGVPIEIQTTEMGVTGIPERVKCNILDLDYHRYRDKREKQLDKKIKQIDPFRPEIGSLMVRGYRPKTPPKKLPPLPNIVVDSVSSNCRVLTGVYAVRINNTVIYKNTPNQSLSNLERMKLEPWHEKCSSWTYYFNMPAKRVGRSKLYIQNLGTVTLRYCWKKIKKPIPFIPEDVYDQVFFFNKNEDVLPPGQKKEISFTFVSDKPGIYSEFWELSFCNICFFDTVADKIVVNMHADSVENVVKTRIAIDKLVSQLHQNSIYKIVCDLIDDVVDKATNIEPLIYPYKNYFLEAEYFGMKNPVCFYHQTEVLKMKDLYAEMSNSKVWDLSITSWRTLMMTKQYDDRMRYYELLRKSHDDLLKPWYEGDSLLKSKYRAMNLLLGQLADKFIMEHIRITEVFLPGDENDRSYASARTSSVCKSRQRVDSITVADPLTTATIRNLFYIQMYEHVATTIETCAGVLSSLDLNRWIEFDFCR